MIGSLSFSLDSLCLSVSYNPKPILLLTFRTKQNSEIQFLLLRLPTLKSTRFLPRLISFASPLSEHCIKFILDKQKQVHQKFH